MNEETPVPPVPPEGMSATGVPDKGHSTLFNVSVRGWIAIIVIGTVCTMSALQYEIKEPLYTLVGMVAGFYLGQKNKEGQS